MAGNGTENRLTVEWAAFTLAPGVTEDDLLNASARLQVEFLGRQKGFVRRELLRGADGRWADLVYWESAEDAGAIVDVAFKSPVCLEYFKLMVAPESSKPEGGVLHFERMNVYT